MIINAPLGALVFVGLIYQNGAPATTRDVLFLFFSLLWLVLSAWAVKSIHSKIIVAESFVEYIPAIGSPIRMAWSEIETLKRIPSLDYYKISSKRAQFSFYTTIDGHIELLAFIKSKRPDLFLPP